MLFSHPSFDNGNVVVVVIYMFVTLYYSQHQS